MTRTDELLSVFILKGEGHFHPFTELLGAPSNNLRENTQQQSRQMRQQNFEIRPYTPLLLWEIDY